MGANFHKDLMFKKKTNSPYSTTGDDNCLEIFSAPGEKVEIFPGRIIMHWSTLIEDLTER